MKLVRKPPHEPTPSNRQTVQLHATIGTPQELIADIIGIDPKTLRKYYRIELDHATAQANATIGGALFNKAKSGDTAAMIFWMKTRAGWREKQEIDHTTNGETLNSPDTAALILIGKLDAIARRTSGEPSES